ncbi:MAG TPA: AAA family ATPase [Thermoplasmata archaeon]|nr:AAA family ATPase [Thermoplasmata archaeon]
MSPPRVIPEDRRPLFERIRPTKMEEILGDPTALRAASDWARTWAASRSPPRWRALILSGPPGVGKTTLAGAIASSFGWTIVEMNASEARNQGAIEQVAGRAALSHTLGLEGRYRTPAEGGRTLILLDEADSLSGRADAAGSNRADPRSFRDFLVGRYRTVTALSEAWGLGAEGRPAPFESWSTVPLSGGRGAWNRLPEAQRDLADWKDSSRRVDTSDRGGYAAMLRLVRSTQQPVILTVNDEREFFRHAPAIRGLARHVRLPPIEPAQMLAFLQRTVRREGLSVAPAGIDGIVRRSRGDLRAAINDLEAIAPLPPGPLQVSVLALRDLTSDFEAVTGTVLTEPRFYRAVEIRELLDANPEDLWPWIEENLPRFAPSGAALEAGLGRLTAAELLVARARRQRVYALWSFASEIMTGGTGLAIGAAQPARENTVAFPEFLAGMGRSRASRALRLGLLTKAGHAVHMSRRKATTELEPFLFDLFASRSRAALAPARAARRAVAVELGLTGEEVVFLGGQADDAPSTAEEPPEEQREAPAESAQAVRAPEPSAPPVGEKPSLPRPHPPKERKRQRRLGEF